MKLKPKPGESKQDFLRRCAAAYTDDGMAPEDALPLCTAGWNEARMQRLAAFVDDGQATLAAPDVTLLEAPTGDDADTDAPRRFSILAYTGKLIDWGWMGRFIIDLDGMQLAQAKVPALLNHSREQIVGTIDQSTTDKNGFYVFGAFSAVTDCAKETLALAEEGVPWQASVGVNALEITHLERGASREVNGITVEGPVDIWEKSEVFETSWLLFGADDDTAATANMNAGGTPRNPNPKEADVKISKEMRAVLEKAGLPATASNDEAVQFMAGLDPEKLTAALAAQSGEELQQPKTAPAPSPTPAPAPANTPGSAATLSGQDVLALQQRGKRLGLTDEQVTKALGDLNTTVGAATDALFTLAAKENPPLSPTMPSMEMGATARDKLVLAASDGLAMRVRGVQLEKPADGAEDFRGMRLTRVGEAILSANGVNVSRLSDRQVADMLVGAGSRQLSSTIGSSSSDFRQVISATANRVLLSGYQQAASTWEAWCAITDATDFKPMVGVNISDLPELQPVGENGEYQHGSLRDFAEQYSVNKFGIKFALTWEMLINDDLRAFTRIPLMFGQAARRKETEQVYGKLVASTWMMSDGKPLFHTAHGNVATTGLGPVSSAGLTDCRKVMRTQKTPQGAIMNVAPEYLIVPAAQETQADVLMRSLASTEGGKNEGVVNPHAGKMTPIVEGYLDQFSEKAWYAAASPFATEHFEVAFLDGRREPEVFEREAFDIDGIEYKLRHVFGVGCMGYRGLFKNPGK